jgi:hypothetical protein
VLVRCKSESGCRERIRLTAALCRERIECAYFENSMRHLEPRRQWAEVLCLQHNPGSLVEQAAEVLATASTAQHDRRTGDRATSKVLNHGLVPHRLE